MAADGQNANGGWNSLHTTIGLLTIAVFLMVAFQTYQLVREKKTLTETRSNQEQPVQEGIKLRRQLDAVAGGLAKLAEEGDAGAKQIVEGLRRQGINVKVPGSTAAPAPSTAPEKP
jgi:regulatory protein YycI of two-component signal transduction system YycFG